MVSQAQIIEYFRNELRNKLVRPICQKELTLWDQSCWLKMHNIHTHYIINSNEFLQFWFRVCYELCCVNDVRGQCLKNALDKYFYFLLDFENYFNIFIQRRMFRNRVDAMKAVVDYNLDKNNLKSKIRRNKCNEDFFKEFVGRVNEWNYWKKVIITQFIKINLGNAAFESAQQNNLSGLTNLIKNTEDLWERGIDNNTNNE